MGAVTDLSKAERRRKPCFSPIVGRNRKATEWTFDCLAGRPKHLCTPRPSVYELLHPHRPGPMARPKLHDAFAHRFVAEARASTGGSRCPPTVECGSACRAEGPGRARPGASRARGGALAVGRSGSDPVQGARRLGLRADAEPGSAEHGLPEALSPRAPSCSGSGRHPGF